MPKRTDLKRIMVIGSGPIVIGQACEFDYSGSQACKALREEGYKVILVNSNPATIMTDPQMADVTYIEPLSPEILEKIIELLLDIIQSGVEINSFNTKKALKNKNNNSGELAGYYDFLIKQGKTPTTSDAYRKAINQVMKKRGYSSLEELNGHLDYEIEYYRHNDKKSHNTHIAALMQYKLYLTINAEEK